MSDAVAPGVFSSQKILGSAMVALSFLFSN